MRPVARIRAVLSRLGRHELGVLVSVCAIAGGVWAFVELADEVIEGSTRRFDQWVLLGMRERGDPTDPLGPRWFEEMVRDITALGGVAILGLLVVAVLGFLIIQRKRRPAAFIACTVLGAMAMSSLLKLGFARPRPELVPHASHVYTSSFPSGHAMLSAAVYLTLGAQLARTQDSLTIKAYLLVWSLVTTALVGLSRVYMGVHWPTDVLAGWAAGAAWASLWWLGARAFDRWRRARPPRSACDGAPRA